jgi:hypothetical protein
MKFNENLEFRLMFMVFLISFAPLKCYDCKDAESSLPLRAKGSAIPEAALNQVRGGKVDEKGNACRMSNN